VVFLFFRVGVVWVFSFFFLSSLSLFLWFVLFLLGGVGEVLEVCFAVLDGCALTGSFFFVG